MDRAEHKEGLIPLVLSLVALAVFGVYGAINYGPRGPGVVILVVGLQVLVGVPIMIGAFFIAARILSISFGFIGPALKKAVAIYTFPTAVSLLIPWAPAAWLVSLGLYVGLLAWFFELDMLELVVTAIVIMVVRWVALAIIGGIILALVT